MKTDICWFATERMSYACCTMLNELFDSHDCIHHDRIYQPETGAIIVFHGQHQALLAPQAEYLNLRYQSLPWRIMISVGDENCDFNYAALKHPRQRLWVQTPKAGKVVADRYLIEGYMADERAHLMSIESDWLMKFDPVEMNDSHRFPRDLDWTFAGQVTHERRHDCVKALRSIPNGNMVMTNSFGAGVGKREYYTLLRRAKVVPCPAGPATPDSFRFAEALEAGAVPLIDGHALDGVGGYWKMTLGKYHPFMVIDDWATLPEVMAYTLEHWEREQRVTQYWWKKYKLTFRNWLAHDLVRLGAV